MLRLALLLVVPLMTAACTRRAEEAPPPPVAPKTPKVEAPPARCDPAPGISTLDVFTAGAGDRPATPTAVLATEDALYVVGYAFDGRAGMTWTVRRAPAHDPTRWATVDRFEDGSTFAAGVAETKAGVIVVGNRRGGSGSTWIARERARGEAGRWRTVDAYTASPGGTSVPRDVAGDAEHPAIVVGEVDFADGEPSAWLARRRGADGGWSNTDVFRAAGAESTAAAAVALHGRHVYVVGNARAKKGGRWLVRRSVDGGLTWKTVDQRAGAVAVAVAVAPDGAVYVVGYVETMKNRRAWLILRSTDRGATWTALREGAPAGRALTTANAVVVGEDGRVYVGGSVDGPGGTRWTLRRSTEDGHDFETVDDYHHDASRDAADKIDDLTIDDRGRVVAVGDAHTRSRAWVVRGHGCAEPRAVTAP